MTDYLVEALKKRARYDCQTGHEVPSLWTLAYREIERLRAKVRRLERKADSPEKD